MNTATITRALRKSDLTEYKPSKKTINGKIPTQEGWILTKSEGYAVIEHSLMNWSSQPEYSHAEHTTTNYAEFIKWVDGVQSHLIGAGFTVEIVTGERKVGTFKHIPVEIIEEIRVSKSEEAK